ncbi:putative auto-transporter adhesin, head GIN domain [Kordia sp. SMS9]|uniref:head GIN domain-containing protein n=1 Tax=Kordia sp. SMS9 TaxID=2282170 RepID=UPI000E0D837E|nr:head GIN domain-containing protein [Kordia sp. SMS9]AXG68901.1 putative auto-transporter adhesin, head GIN domain [Kordia sp. SMS9]
MKHIFTCIFCVLAYAVTAQTPIEKQVGDFDEVKVFDLIEINLIKSEESKVVITGADTEDVEIVNKRGKLKIRMKFDRIFDGSQTFVEVYYKDVDIIDANEGAIIVANETMTQPYLKLKAQEGGRIIANLEVDNLDSRAVTGGIIETSGKVKHQEIVLNTGGIYEGKKLLTEQTKVKVSAGGEAYVSASVLADARVRAGGYIEIHGDPETVKKNKVFGGKIKVK